jgi:hypothetical protein
MNVCSRTLAIDMPLDNCIYLNLNVFNFFFTSCNLALWLAPVRSVVVATVLQLSDEHLPITLQISLPHRPLPCPRPLYAWLGTHLLIQIVLYRDMSYIEKQWKNLSILTLQQQANMLNSIVTSISHLMIQGLVFTLYNDIR